MSFVPSLADINALAGANGYSVVSTFSGTGGSSLGYRWAGFKVRAALEFVPEAAESYQANFPDTPVMVRDIREVSGSDLLKFASLKVGELDLLDGSPPCSGFATGGLRHKGWGKEKSYSEDKVQRVDDLFFEFVRILKDLQPKVFVAENVRGLVSGKAQGYYLEIHRALQAAGYHVENSLIDAQQLGVPQSRIRLIIMGVRNDLAALGVRPSFPKPIYSQWNDKPSKMRADMPRPVTIAQAFSGLEQPREDAEQRQCHWLKTGSKTREAWEKTNPFIDSGMLRATYLKEWGQNARFHWFRQRPDRPSVTVTATVPCLLHWKYPRSYTIPEVKRLQSFPDDFTLTGNYEQQYERVGRGVPPLLMMKVAERVRDDVLAAANKVKS